MTKRLSEVSASSQRPWSPQLPPFKRAKKDEAAEPEVAIIDDGLSSIPDTSSEAEEELPPPVRDPKLYYEDGSITFRVGDVLFKVSIDPSTHRALLTAGNTKGSRVHTQNRIQRFRKKIFDVPPKLADAAKARGTCDENPIIIPQVKASQFRMLMELIYRLHYINLFECDTNIWQQFVFYLNVSTLASRFAMGRIEKWARPEFAAFVKKSGKKLSEAANEASKSNKPDEDEDEREGEGEGEDGDGDEDEDETATRDNGTDNVDGGSERGSPTAGAQGPHAVGGTGMGVPNGSNDPSNAVVPAIANPSPNNINNGIQPNNSNDPNRANLTGGASSSSDQADSDEEDNDEDEEMEDTDSKEETVLPPEEETNPTFQLMDALLYAESVSDSCLHYDIRNVLQYHCLNPNVLPVSTLVDLFKVAGLQEKDPSMFGYLFILLLCHGNQVWKQDIFTRMDRMAFFSAQSYLTPFPDSLKTFVVVPLFTKPISVKSFVTIFSDATTDQSCAAQCYIQAFICWQKVFDDAYYVTTSNKHTLDPIKALISLPRRRLDLARRLSKSRCKHECHWKLLSQIDRDIQGVYARLAEYYQGIE
ncbi:unnamed protein product [Rhizoctonia solani]|uniref:BTB domain-containing protein n=1 Tax=Rhizoctonia solani TaxID=456999 RepID=A0A8H2WJM5_9AGAM|nr:unnamed protein product [Rhizoctonia solani]